MKKEKQWLEMTIPMGSLTKREQRKEIVAENGSGNLGGFSEKGECSFWSSRSRKGRT